MVRKTYVYDPETKTMVEGCAAPRGSSGDGFRFSDRIYSDNPFVGKDGKVIDSRKKHRAYMKRHGLTTMDDFKQTWADAEKRRNAHYTDGSSDRRARREAVERSIARLEK